MARQGTGSQQHRQQHRQPAAAVAAAVAAAAAAAAAAAEVLGRIGRGRGRAGSWVDRGSLSLLRGRGALVRVQRMNECITSADVQWCMHHAREILHSKSL